MLHSILLLSLQLLLAVLVILLDCCDCWLPCIWLTLHYEKTLFELWLTCIKSYLHHKTSTQSLYFNISIFVTKLPSLVAIGTVVVNTGWFYLATWSCRTTRLKGGVTLWVGTTRGKLPSCHVWLLWALWWWVYNVLVWHKISQDRAIKGSCDFM